MKFILTLHIILTAIFASCTYNISMAHTEGQASDVVDSTQSPDVKPNIEIPNPLSLP